MARIEKTLGVYLRPVERKPRGWGVCPPLVRYPPAFKARFRHWAPKRHARRASALRRLIERLYREQQRATSDACFRFGDDSALIADGSHDPWPPEARDACLQPAQAIAVLLDARRLHSILAGCRRSRRD